MIFYKSQCEHFNEFLLKIIVLFIYKLYLKELIKYKLIYAQFSKVTENYSTNNTFCFTRPQIAGKLKAPKMKKMLTNQLAIPPVKNNLTEFALKKSTDRIMKTKIINENFFERLFMYSTFIIELYVNYSMFAPMQPPGFEGSLFVLCFKFCKTFL